METLGRVAKYYHANGFKRKEIHALLEDFLIKADPSANIVLWQSAIDRQVKNAERYPLVELDGVAITKKELDICCGLSGAPSKVSKTSKRSGRQKNCRGLQNRLMFTLICLAKFANAVNDKNDGWVNRQDNEIFRLANIKATTKRQALMYSDLRDLGLIRFSKKVDNVNVRVLCLDDDGDPELFITDYRNLGNQFLRYCGEPYIECASCGLVVRRSNNSQLYCEECGVAINRQHANDNYRRRATEQAS